jgi:hypothetical protein
MISRESKSIFVINERLGKQALVQTKRNILLTKLRIRDKQDCIKNLKDAISFEQKYLEIKTNDIKQNQELLNKNCKGLTKQTDIIAKKVKQKEAENIIKTSELNKLKNQIFNKESQSRKYEERQKTLLKYKKFIQDIFLYSGEEAKLGQLVLNNKKKVFITEHFENIDKLSKISGKQSPEKFVSLLNKIEDDNLMLIRTLQNQKHEIQSLKARIAQ